MLEEERGDLLAARDRGALADDCEAGAGAATARWGDGLDGGLELDGGRGVERCDQTYAAGLQRTAHRWSTSGAVRVRMVTGTLADYDAYTQHSGEDPGDPETRTRYASWRAREFGQETLFWPPARNGTCWCESGRKYKKCCGEPVRN
ncbi:SEC-C metal-binding domain-containing protein [Streptomyces botrytidirepellens]|uniref:SEC-C metal-binding domain-containing protein n=1 Tax=Streptomyces botrytidirepellens TaxID=2486417 RepID=UPI001C82BBEE|nr:SEC-C metal-binding domain-containing protein [Streptomyces botrytidirepellens]